MVLRSEAHRPNRRSSSIALPMGASVLVAPFKASTTPSSGTSRSRTFRNVTPATFHGTGLEAVVAIADLMNRGAREYEEERQRGDRREAPPRDRNVALDENGTPLAILSSGAIWSEVKP